MAKAKTVRKSAPRTAQRKATPAETRAATLDQAAEITPSMSEKKLTDTVQDPNAHPKARRAAAEALFQKADEEGQAKMIEDNNKRLSALGY